ncbi:MULTISPECIES: RNA polymerase sigma factor [unclassified Streptomyces]|nr:RNA polymerase sigma factor [Streptomyces sp. BK340]
MDAQLFPEGVGREGCAGPGPRKCSAEHDRFAEKWIAARPHVVAYARFAMRNAADAEDLGQAVAIRAWRGYVTFRGESTFLTWVMAIATREAARLAAHRLRRDEREVPLDRHGETVTDADPPHADPPSTDWLPALAEQARTRGDLNPTEYAVVRARLALPGRTWDEIGTTLDLPGSRCAVAHCRAVVKLRVALFLHHPELLGGEDALRHAMEQAARVPHDPLTEAEADVFGRAVLERRSDHRRRNWPTLLRSACTKVVGHLDMP